MDKMSNGEFINFLKFFRDDYFCSVKEISKPDNSDRPLVPHKFKMYSFDEMCKKYPMMEGDLPKTMDAIHYEIDEENDKLTLYIIEFKTFNIEGEKSTYTILKALHEKLKKLNKKTCEYSVEKFVPNGTLKYFEIIKEHFIDSIEFDLIVKPIETLLVSLPWLYDEYCVDNAGSVVKKDIRDYLNNIDIKLVVFVNRYAPNTNVSADRWSGHHIDNKLKSVYHRWHLSSVIVEDNERILSRDRFQYFIGKEHLSEK